MSLNLSTTRNKKSIKFNVENSVDQHSQIKSMANEMKIKHAFDCLSDQKIMSKLESLLMGSLSKVEQTSNVQKEGL